MNEPQYCKVEGIAGYLPVFSTMEEAEQSSESGKYQIKAVRGFLPNIS